MSKHVDPDTILLKMPSLRAVKAFVAAAKYESFTRAAEELNLSQSALSRAIQKLEEQLGQPLFERKPREVVLTEVRQALRRYLWPLPLDASPWQATPGQDGGYPLGRRLGLRRRRPRR